MARYTITYLDGETDDITADCIEPGGGQYVAWTNRCPVAYIPARNVRSVLRQDTPEAATD